MGKSERQRELDRFVRAIRIKESLAIIEKQCTPQPPQKPKKAEKWVHEESGNEHRPDENISLNRLRRYIAGE